MARAKPASRSESSKTKSARKGTQSRNSRSNRKPSPEELPDYTIMDPKEIEESTDVYLDIPVVHVGEINFELDDLRAHLAVLAEAGHFVQLSAGAGVRLGKVELDIKGVETQA